MAQDPGQPEIVDSGGQTPLKRALKRYLLDDWEPFAGAPRNVQKRYVRQFALVGEAKRPLIGIKLFCIECMGYSAAEARRCGSRSCPLYAFNRRIFKQPAARLVLNAGERGPHLRAEK